MSETVAVRRAGASWNGTLSGGEGRLSLESSGALKDAPASWASRVKRPDGRTSPEELLAAAHAACFAMALSHTIAGMGGEPAEIEVEAACSFDHEAPQDLRDRARCAWHSGRPEDRLPP